jgi:hypothetical protein
MRIADNAALWSHDHCRSEIKTAADQELEACIEWLREYHQGKCAGGTENLRRSRRPKPPSLKEQALEALERMHDTCLMTWDNDTIRRALEALPE